MKIQCLLFKPCSSLNIYFTYMSLCFFARLFSSSGEAYVLSLTCISIFISPHIFLSFNKINLLHQSINQSIANFLDSFISVSERITALPSARRVLPFALLCLFSKPFILAKNIGRNEICFQSEILKYYCFAMSHPGNELVLISILKFLKIIHFWQQYWWYVFWTKGEGNTLMGLLLSNCSFTIFVTLW